MRPSLPHPMIGERRHTRRTHRWRRPAPEPEAAVHAPGSAPREPDAAIHAPGSAPQEPDAAIHAPGSAPREPDAAAQQPDSAAQRVREAGGPTDRAFYACQCGYLFAAAVSTTVECPHCGTAQAW